MKQELHDGVEAAIEQAATIESLETELRGARAEADKLQREHDTHRALCIAAEKEHDAPPDALVQLKKRIEDLTASIPVLKEHQTARIASLVPDLKSHIRAKRDEARDLQKQVYESALFMLHHSLLLLAQACGGDVAIDFIGESKHASAVFNQIKKRLKDFPGYGLNSFTGRYHEVMEGVEKNPTFREIALLRKIDADLEEQIARAGNSYARPDDNAEKNESAKVE